MSSTTVDNRAALEAQKRRIVHYMGLPADSKACPDMNIRGILRHQFKLSEEQIDAWMANPNLEVL